MNYPPFTKRINSFYVVQQGIMLSPSLPLASANEKKHITIGL